MPTLIERINKLSGQIKSLADSQVTEEEANRLATRAEEFSEPSNALLVPARQFELLAAKGIQMNTLFLELSVEVRALKSSIDAIKVKYDADPKSILVPDTNWRLNTRTRLTKSILSINDHLLTAWKNYALGLMPNIDQGLLLVLRSSPTHSAIASRVEQLTAELHRISERLPTSEDEINSPERIAENLHHAMANLPPDIPEPVRELFIAINQGTATAAHLTDEAVEWLGEKQLLHTLRVIWGVV
ncbi:hypothetical protein ACFLYN_02115 [Chloroflexota bacterium]